MGQLFYFIKETFRGFFHAKLMTFVSIITIAITLFFLSCVLIIILNVRNWIELSSTKAGVVVYLSDGVYQDSVQCSLLLQRIEALPAVESVILIDKQMAMERFEKLYGSDMLDAVDENPLPASAELVLSPNFLKADIEQSLKKDLEQLNGIDGVAYSNEWLSITRSFKKFFITFVAILIPIILFALHFIIANTIKLTIYARKDLIQNMRYVGATDIFIKTPFVLEGMLQGVCGGIIGATGLFVCKLFLLSVPLYWGGWYISVVIIGTGLVFGWIGSIVAVRRFLT